MMNLSWENKEHTLLLIEICGDWTWDDYHQNIDTISSLLEPLEKPVILLVDLRQAGRVPKDAFDHMTKGNEKLSPKVKAQILVSENRWLEAIVAIMNHLMPEEKNRFVIVPTMEKAYKKVAVINRGNKRRRRYKANT